ncbi:sushi, nidogen and EGF-like domain-containing protein 1 [Ostrea edulis]|uniref:sushi, nidogen and EGF-like domain-containing protein 1 n=1 Tax=Ostrea edulis TaxID=37623 RepID=UPI0024AE8AF7|nr:sushi, nidogen and EGF-like domain-containing protein 1 [Ostrea edulis]
MYGAQINTLNINVSTPVNGNERLWSMSGDQGNQWHQTSVSLPWSYSLKIFIEAIQGGSFEGDIAIDNVNITTGSYDGIRHYPIKGNTLTGDDESTSITFLRGIPIGKDTYHKVYMSTNGLVTFNKSVTTYQPVLDSSYPFLAPYWADLYPTGNEEGSVYYKVYKNTSELRKASTYVQKFSRITSFKAQWMLAVTWNNTKFPSGSDRITVQCVVITDYISTHVIFDYVNVSIKYRGNNVGIGFNNGTLVRNPYSLTPGTHQMSTHIGNTGLVGLWFYTVTQDGNDCVSGPCEHGICEDLYRDFRCHCSNAFTGKRCQTDIDECATSTPCLNGGTCVNNLGSFTCSCLSGWTGSMCEQGVNYSDMMCNRDEICCRVSQCLSNNHTYFPDRAILTRKEEVSVTDVVGIVLGVLLAVVSIISVALCVIAAYFRRQRNQERHRRIQSTYETITVMNTEEVNSPIYTNTSFRSNARK